MKNYKLEFSTEFKDDLLHIITYISDTLGNPLAADRFNNDVQKAIQRRSQMPLSFEPVRSKFDRGNIYYRIYVGNYIVYYVVQGDTMKVTRLVYGARDIGRLL